MTKMRRALAGIAFVAMLALSLAITDADCDTLIAAVDRFVERRADLLAD